MFCIAGCQVFGNSSQTFAIQVSGRVGKRLCEIASGLTDRTVLGGIRSNRAGGRFQSTRQGIGGSLCLFAQIGCRTLDLFTGSGYGLLCLVGDILDRVDTGLAAFDASNAPFAISFRSAILLISSGFSVSKYARTRSAICAPYRPWAERCKKCRRKPIDGA